jgi:hypothetical protein
MKIIILVALFTTSLFAGGTYPQMPDYRYAERIPYCRRDVSQGDKLDVFDVYRARGWSFPGPRSDYKIDHYIPLCAGGSNNKNNLWPQHKTVYELTDPLEQYGCDALKNGKIKQNALINLIIQGKQNHDQIPGILDQINHL